MTMHGRWVQWLGFLCVLVAGLLFSVGAGILVVRTTAPVQVGRGAMGSWAELADHGVRVRLDGVELAPSFPNAFDPNKEVIAPDGFEFLRVRMTVEVLVGSHGLIGCALELRNRDGEELGDKVVGIEGTPVTDCNPRAAVEESGALMAGDHFESQSVFVVLPDELDSFTLDVMPSFINDGVFWTFDFG